MTMFREQKLRSPFCGDDDLVFCTATGKPHSHGNVLETRAVPGARPSGLAPHVVSLGAHTHASLWIKGGGDIITLSKRLGHSGQQEGNIVRLPKPGDEGQQDATASG